MEKQSKCRQLLYVLSASATDKNVKVEIIQATSVSGTAIVKFDYKGVVKTYKVVFTPLA